MKNLGHAAATATFILLLGVATSFGRSQAGLLAGAALFGVFAIGALLLLRGRATGPAQRIFLIVLSALGGCCAVLFLLVGLAG